MSNILQFPIPAKSLLRFDPAAESPAALASLESLPPAVRDRLARIDRGEDMIFMDIQLHQQAIDAHRVAVDAECAAEEKGVSAEVLAEYKEQTSAAFRNMMFRGTTLAFCCAGSRAGLIALAKHLEQQFDMEADCGGCSSMPDEVGREKKPF